MHEQKNWKLLEVMRSGQGSLKNPLALIISTTGWWSNSDYPLYNMWEQGRHILNHDFEDDSWFYMIFQLDEDDEFTDSNKWKKSIPTLGIAVDEEYIKNRIQEAINTPSKEVEIKVKNLNMWVNSAQTWIPDNKLQDVSKKFGLDMFNKEENYQIIGVDIAERSDLCCVTSLINYNNVIYLKAYPFICQNAYNNSPNKEMYRQWVKNGYLTLVDADSIDIDWVIKLIQDLNEQLSVAVIGYDSWHAQQLKIACEKQGLPMRAVKQSIGCFTESTSALEHMILTKKVIIDSSPVTRWCFSNVLIKTDENENRKPVKSSKNQKIDIVIAFIQSIKIMMELEGIISDEELKAIALN